MSKLTLSVDSRVVSRAKRLAKRQGVSVSKIVESYLAAMADEAAPSPPDTPILRSLRGTLKSADPGVYRKHLAAKCR